MTGTTNQETPFDKQAQSYQVGWRKKCDIFSRGRYDKTKPGVVMIDNTKTN